MKLILSIFFALISFVSFSQIINPTEWTYEVKPANVKVGDEVEIIFNAKIIDGYKLYAAEMDPDIGPTVLEFKFTKISGLQLIGKPKANKSPKKSYDEIWEADVLVFEKAVKYTQKAKVTGANASLFANLNYQTCDHQSCVPGDNDFNIKINVAAGTDVLEEVGNEDKPDETIVTEQPVDTTVLDVTNATSELAANASQSSDKPEAESMWKFLLIAFGAGFATIFMPCIYPIMPMTVSYFTKQKGGKGKAIIYGVFIMLIFALMGVLTMPLGASFMNELSTHWLPNTIFFFLFVFFGLAFLGVFDIILPHETVNKIDRLGEKGGLVGLFFMALTLVVVSFSCTVPFVGSLLIGAAGGEIMKPIYGMLAFGLPFALVFGGLAMFPQLLKSLPKSGGWLNELKVVFGLLEFALALKFLSNIDLAYHWNLIHRNIFLVIWIVAAVVIGLYIIGFMRMPSDDRVKKWSFVRIGFATLFFAVALYMVPGVTNKPLTLLSGILPPLPVHTVTNSVEKKGLPHGLEGYKEIEGALAQSKESGKPVLIDFTGYACANCRKMEEHVWSKPDVLKSLKEDFVIASLYVDDKKELPEERQYVSKYDGKSKTTIGAKNFDYQMSVFNSNAQPYYVIVDAEGKKLIEPVAYTSYENFKDFLERGKAAYKK